MFSMFSSRGVSLCHVVAKKYPVTSTLDEVRAGAGPHSEGSDRGGAGRMHSGLSADLGVEMAQFMLSS